MKKLLILASMSEALTGLIALGVACWPDRNVVRTFFGMLTFGVLAALFLILRGGKRCGRILLWPAVAVHIGLSVLLVWAWRKERQASEATT